MNVESILFVLFGVVMLVSALAVVACRNPFASAISLVVLIIGLAGLFLLLESPFLATIQILVYAGAIMVLFLFVIMMLELRLHPGHVMRWISAVGAALLIAGFAVEFWFLIHRPMHFPVSDNPAWSGGIEPVMIPLFSHYLLPFEVIALILLVSMIGVVVLSRQDKEGGS